jgi:hypothetical protein
MDPTVAKIFKLRKAASDNDMDTVKEMMNHSDYCYDIGREAVGIAFSLKHDEIAHQLLSLPGALDKYFDHPFMVDSGLRAAVAAYITKRDGNKEQ